MAKNEQAKGKTADEAEEERKQEGIRLSLDGKVKPKGGGFIVVEGDGAYLVDKEDGDTVCDCDDFVGATTLQVSGPDGGSYVCKHIYAVKHHVEFADKPATEQVFDGDKMT